MLGVRVEFHHGTSGDPISFDPYHTWAVVRNAEHGGTFLISPTGFAYHVKEEYREVVAALDRATRHH